MGGQEWLHDCPAQLSERQFCLPGKNAVRVLWDIKSPVLDQKHETSEGITTGKVSSFFPWVSFPNFVIVYFHFYLLFMSFVSSIIFHSVCLPLYPESNLFLPPHPHRATRASPISLLTIPQTTIIPSLDYCNNVFSLSWHYILDTAARVVTWKLKSHRITSIIYQTPNHTIAGIISLWSSSSTASIGL